MDEQPASPPVVPPAQPAAPPPAFATIPTSIRRYVSVDHFQVDAANMAAHGWSVVAQAEASGRARSGWIWVAVITGILGLFFFPLWIGTIIALLIAYGGRKKEIVVTYRGPTPA